MNTLIPSFKQQFLRFSIFSLVVLGVNSCNTNTAKNEREAYVEEEKLERFRPRYHFTPKENWMNDPNGLVYKDGEYHLFFQHYPDSTVWGPMHWGHAISTNLLNWNEQPIALYPDSLGYIFSGSAVVDKKGLAGFGQETLVAIYTYHDPINEQREKDDFQTQGIAYSSDNGLTWTKYNANPVIKNPGIRDFRDPKVFWNEEKLVWQMVLVAKDHVQFYESIDLKDWKKISEFRFNDNPELGVWECPDLFKLKIEDTGEEKWILIVSHGGESAPNGGSGTRYFVGDYDGTRFSTEQKYSKWIDYGTDNYAGVTYNNVPNNRRVFIGWMSNWNYATVTPTTTWRSAMTLPRELSLIQNDNGYLLRSKPVKEISQLFSPTDKANLKGDYPYNFYYDNLQTSNIRFDATINDSINIQFSNNNGDKYVIKYDRSKGQLVADRSKSGIVDFNSNFKNSSIQTVEVGNNDRISVEVFMDESSVEIFINGGEYVLTNQVFPTNPYTNFKILGNNNKIENFQIKELKTQKKHDKH